MPIVKVGALSNSSTACGDLQGIAESVLGDIAWIDSQTGFAHCPGDSMHSTPNGSKDCKIMLNGPPTVTCFHQSCQGVIEQTNQRLRSTIGKAQSGHPSSRITHWQPSQADIERDSKKKADEVLRLRAEKLLVSLLATHTCSPDDLKSESPVRLDGDGSNDWRLLLQLYKPEDILWIGGKFDSGTGHESSFQTQTEWLNTKPTGSFICPNTFKQGVYSRRAENIAELRFLVVESDELTHAQFCSVIEWLSQSIHLRAVVDTGSKSLHAWFDYPAPNELAELKVILPVLKCDPKMFGVSQPCRLPGPMRDTERRQHLIYLDLKKGEP